MVKTHKIIIALAAPVLAVSLSACGSSATDEQKAVADAFTTLAEGVVNNDSGKVCSVGLTPAEKTAESANGKCEDDYTKFLNVPSSMKKSLEDVEVDAEKIVIEGDKATVPSDAIKVKTDTGVRDTKFKRVDGKWYFDN
jgi:hypothetical protein